MMFEKLNENVELCQANLLSEDALIDMQKYSSLIKYISYCEQLLEYILEQVREMAEDKDIKITLQEFEDNVQEKIIYIIETISSEMYIIQNFFCDYIETYPDFVKKLMLEIDGVEALLILLPEEIEKNKCVMLALKS